MENLHTTNAVPEQSYFKGWFIALRNYESFEIEAIKKKIADPMYDESNVSLLSESFSSYAIS